VGRDRRGRPQSGPDGGGASAARVPHQCALRSRDVDRAGHGVPPASALTRV
jgi:hypothetical protein